MTHSKVMVFSNQSGVGFGIYWKYSKTITSPRTIIELDTTPVGSCFRKFFMIRDEFCSYISTTDSKEIALLCQGRGIHELR